MNCGTRRRQGLVLAGVILLAIGLGRGRADVLLETADYTNALTPAYVVGEDQILGARFHVSGTVAVDHIGAHFVKSDGGLIYGALTSLNGSPALPSGTPGSFNPIAETTFAVPNKSSDLLIGLSATLGPGDYALVFGSNRFGATGTAAIGGGDTDKGQPSTFYSTATDWLDITLPGSRFVVTGAQLSDGGKVPPTEPPPAGAPEPPPSEAPEPTALVLACAGAAGLVGCRWLRKKRHGTPPEAEGEESA
jgi:hypothetical protein